MKLSHLLLALMVTAIWGINFSGIKLGVGAVDPFILAGLRFVFCVFPIIFFIPKPDVPLKTVATYGVLFGVGVWGLVNLGIQLGVSAGVASLMLQLSAFMSVFMGYFFLNESITRFKLVGFVLALLGLVLIFSVTDGSVSAIGLAMVLLGAFFWSSTNIIIKKSGAKRVFSFLVWGSLFSPIPLFVIGFFTGGVEAYTSLLDSMNIWVIGSVLFQAIFATLIGFFVWNYLLGIYPVSSVAPLSLLVPGFGFLASAIFFGETIGAIKMIACLLILAGLLIGLFGEKLIARVKSVPLT